MLTTKCTTTVHPLQFKDAKALIIAAFIKEYTEVWDDENDFDPELRADEVEEVTEAIKDMENAKNMNEITETIASFWDEDDVLEVIVQSLITH